MEISPAHALILIIRDRTAKGSHQHELERLKKILLMGVQNSFDRNFFESLLIDPVLSMHSVSYLPSVIDNCKVRRFFETLLSYETLKDSVNKLDAIKLESFYNNLINIHTKYYHEKYNLRNNKTLEEYFNEKPKEYEDGHFRIDNEPSILEYFDKAQRIKLHQMVESCLRSVMCTQKDGLKEDLPKFTKVFENNNFFCESRRMPRKIVKENINLPSLNFGIIFSITDLGNIDTPISQCKFEYNYIKPAEKATYTPHHEWTRFVFPMLMHPFSNGASGTILGQLKLLHYFGNHQSAKTELEKKQDHEFVKEYIKNLICIMLYLGGGHSLYEYIYPLTLKEVQNSLEEFMGSDEITFESLFINDNLRALDAALTLTGEYSRQVIRSDLNIFDVIYDDHTDDISACIKIDKLCKENPQLVMQKVTSKVWTPLQFAVAKRMPYALRTVVRYEFKDNNINRDKDLTNALKLAEEKGDDYPITLLFLATLGIESMGKINTTLVNGKTPYQIALETGSTKIQTSLKRLVNQITYK